MGFWFLDEKAQLALLMAGLAGVSGTLTACGESADPVPSDMRVERRDGRRDVLVADMVPPDMRREKGPVGDPAPFDMRREQNIADPVPWDMKSKLQPPPPPQAARSLPLSRDLRVKVKVRQVEETLELVALPSGARDEGRLAYRWTASGGALEVTGKNARWTPPKSKGLHMVQVTVRDGDRAIAVDIYLHEVR